MSMKRRRVSHDTDSSGEEQLLPRDEPHIPSSSSRGSMQRAPVTQRPVGMSNLAVRRRNVKRYRTHVKLMSWANKVNQITSRREYERANQRFFAPFSSNADEDNAVNDEFNDVNHDDQNAERSPMLPCTVSRNGNPAFTKIDGKQLETNRNGDSVEIRREEINSSPSVSIDAHCSYAEIQDRKDETTLGNDFMISDKEVTEEDVNSVAGRDENKSIVTPSATNAYGTIFALDNNERMQQTPRVKNWVTNLYMIASVVAMSLRCKLTYSATTLLMKSLNDIFIDSAMPRSLQGLWSILSRNDSATMTRHLYCRSCRDDEIGTGETPRNDCCCKKCKQGQKSNSLGYFIQLKLEPQIRQLFSDPAIVKSLKYRFTRKKIDPNGIEDIYDGLKYKEKCAPGGFLSNKYNFSFSFFTDGCQVSNSSKASAWPILLQINELPPHIRKRHTILAAIWVDTIHPDIETIMLPTVRELQSLYNEGIQWTHPIDGSAINSKFVTLVCIADSVARPAILNMTRFNGIYGCTFCYAKGDTGQRIRGRVTFPINETIACRIDCEIREHMQTAQVTGQRSFGVVGLSPLILLPEFDLALGPVVESMHNVFLGVTKLHTTLLLQGNVNEVWYAGGPKNIQNVNSRLMNFRPPSRIARKPRHIESMKQWKASEWRNWIQFYALPCLEGIIRDCDLEHLALLSRSSWIMNKNSIGTEELQEARSSLRQYVLQFQNTFGKKYMRYNIHLLTHLADTVENWGPFWAHSAFPYESWNKKIIDKVTSANGRPLQIATRFLMSGFMNSFLINEQIPDETRRKIFLILKDGTKNIRCAYTKHSLMHSSSFHPIGQYTDRQLHDWECTVLNHHGYQPLQMVRFYKRALINGTNFQCGDEKKSTKTRYCDEFLYNERYGYGKILAIIGFNCNNGRVYGLLIERIGSTGVAFSTRHIENTAPTSQKAFIDSDDNVLPAMNLDTRSQHRITRLPNVWETD